MVWETLRAIVEADNDLKPVIIESAGLIIGSNDLSVFYDEKGKNKTLFSNLTSWYRLEIRAAAVCH